MTDRFADNEWCLVCSRRSDVVRWYRWTPALGWLQKHGSCMLHWHLALSFSLDISRSGSAPGAVTCHDDDALSVWHACPYVVHSKQDVESSGLTPFLGEILAGGSVGLSGFGFGLRA